MVLVPKVSKLWEVKHFHDIIKVSLVTTVKPKPLIQNVQKYIGLKTRIFFSLVSRGLVQVLGPHNIDHNITTCIADIF